MKEEKSLQFAFHTNVHILEHKQVENHQNGQIFLTPPVYNSRVESVEVPTCEINGERRKWIGQMLLIFRVYTFDESILELNELSPFYELFICHYLNDNQGISFFYLLVFVHYLCISIIFIFFPYILLFF